MKPIFLKWTFAVCFLSMVYGIQAQSYVWICSTENNYWKEDETKLQSRPVQTPLLEIDGTEKGVPFKAWGTTFNELDWDYA